MAGFNCNKWKNETYKLTLPDTDETVIEISSPTKGSVDRMLRIYSAFGTIDNENAADAVEELYELMTEIINNNRSGYKITKKQLKEYMDVFMLADFTKDFMQFVTERTNSKN